MIRTWNEMAHLGRGEPEHYVTGYVAGQPVAMWVRASDGGPLTDEQAAALVASKLNASESL